MWVCTLYVDNKFASGVIVSVEVYACCFKYCLMHKLCLHSHVFMWALANTRWVQGDVSSRHLFKGNARHLL